MRYAMTLLLLVPMALASMPPDDDLIKKDLAKFQGRWQAVSLIGDDGKPATADELRHTHLIVDGTKFTLKTKDATIRGTFSIDPSRVPKTIDAVLEDGRPQDKLLGIYRIDGELRKSCFVAPGKERPRDFPADGKGALQFVWKPKARKPK